MLITLDDFYRAYLTFRPEPNPEQQEAIRAPKDAPLYLVAGPGTGKTATLSLRILKLILVDEVPPGGILATTFTVKAAAELRSRVLSWGYQLLEELDKDPRLASATKDRLKKIDINQVVTGTVDSICEEALRRYREAATQPPILVDEFVARTLLLREGLFPDKRYKDDDLDSFLLGIKGTGKWGWNLGAKTDLLRTIWDRRHHDLVIWPAFIANVQPDEGVARQLLDEVLRDYKAALESRGIVDFALLESEMLSRLRAGKLSDFTDTLRVVLVDEYQDTNLLQEQIYFELAKACGGALTVVGDDDQSLYRFRGATVELFSNFPERYAALFPTKPVPIFLKTNYRSTQAIISFVNSYAQLDASYQQVRSKAGTRLDSRKGSPQGLPVLGLFRDDINELATELAALVNDIFRNGGFSLPDGTKIEANPSGGDLGDCALLCSSPREHNNDKERLPLLIRNHLLSHGIETFNPRGQDLASLPVVAQLGGLLLECLDPGGTIEGSLNGLGRDTRQVFNTWRTAATSLVYDPAAPAGLQAYAEHWQNRDPGRPGYAWPFSVPVLELVYALVHYFPALHNDPEGQVYLEAFTRQVSACEQIGKFKARVVSDPANVGVSQASVAELLRSFLAPIASGAVGVNEDLMDQFPRDRLSILSIHQSKGLEFPLTIVDIGSDFQKNHHAHAFKRFPKVGGQPQHLEDMLRPYTDLKKPSRPGYDRAFDDLYRQYFVAYSRAQEVLVLVGLNTTLNGAVHSVAAGWSRDQVNHWSTKRPFILI